MSTSTPPPPPPPPHVYETPPPPPPKPNSSHASRSGTPTHSPHRHPYDSPSNQSAVPELLPEPFVPHILTDKSRDDLLHILSTPELLDALYLSNHPSAGPIDAAIASALQGNIAHAQRLISTGQSLDAAREATSVALMQTRSLERAWREKEKEMFDALGKFSAPALHARLGQAVAEADAMGKALEESFLDEDARDENGDESGGKAGKDVENFVKNYRSARSIYHLRKERKERWDENRVGGWR